MKTKKLIAGLISAVTMATVSASAIATAAEAFNVKISSAEAAAGEDFTLTMDLSNIPADGINGCEFGISYDPSLVSISNVALGDGVYADDEGLVNPLEYNIESDVVSVMYAIGSQDAANYLKGDVSFLNISGTVKSDAAAGSKATFKVVPIDRASTPGSTDQNADIVFGHMTSDDKITKYDPTFTDGVLTVNGEKPIGSDSTKPTQPKPTASESTKPTQPKPTAAPPTVNFGKPSKYGDVNVDGKVNVTDVVKLNLYLLDSEQYPLGNETVGADVAAANADVVRDQVLNSSDSLLIMNYVTMLTEESALGK